MWAKEADLKLAVFDAGARPLVDPDTAALVDGDTVAVVNKSDLRGEQIAVKVAGQEALSVSALTGEGIDGMICRIEQTVARKFGVSEAPALTRVRHRAALKQCHESLVRANQGTEAEIVGEEVRMAARALGRITGRVDVEEILDVIFRDFCIGK
jgi:tRNA modification GTPase